MTRILAIAAVCPYTDQHCLRRDCAMYGCAVDDEDPRIELAEYRRDFPDADDAPRGWEP